MRARQVKNTHFLHCEVLKLEELRVFSFISSSSTTFILKNMASAPTLRQKNEIFKNRSAKGTVASKAAQKTQSAKKINYSYWIIGVLAFALFGGGILSVIDLIF